MYFDSLQALLTMGGHGPYVWTAYALSVAVLAAVLVAPARRRRRLLREIRSRARREAARAPQETLHAPGT